MNGMTTQHEKCQSIIIIRPSDLKTSHRRQEGHSLCFCYYALVATLVTWYKEIQARHLVDSHSDVEVILSITRKEWSCKLYYCPSILLFTTDKSPILAAINGGEKATSCMPILENTSQINCRPFVTTDTSYLKLNLSIIVNPSYYYIRAWHLSTWRKPKTNPTSSADVHCSCKIVVLEI